MNPVVTAYVALGANLGDARATLLDTLQALEHLPHTCVLRTSSLYRTAPWQANGPDYINAVVALATGLLPPDLLHALQNLENQAGRLRSYQNAPRTLDLDILLYGDVQLDTPELSIPHPRMRQRAFVLVPLAEIAPQYVSRAELEAVADQPIACLE